MSTRQAIAAHSTVREAPVRRTRPRRCQQCQETVSLAAHDMKTPLAVMNGYVELLLCERLGPLSHAQREVLLQMQSSGERLGHFLEDTLSFSALKAGTFTPKFEPGTLQDCLDEIAAFWEPCFQKRGVNFRVVNAEGSLPLKFDSHKTQRVLSNLLENALRLTPVGGLVTLSTSMYWWDRRLKSEPSELERRSRALAAANSVCITVSDNGPGIAPEHHDEIFHEYVRLPQPGRDSGGTGLGLAIAKNLVTALRGKIWVESKLGRGSNFHIVLPLKPE
jgi:two-component system, NtrC family, sensor histidine kinase KinB